MGLSLLIGNNTSLFINIFETFGSLQRLVDNIITVRVLLLPLPLEHLLPVFLLDVSVVSLLIQSDIIIIDTSLFGLVQRHFISTLVWELPLKSIQELLILSLLLWSKLLITRVAAWTWLVVNSLNKSFHDLWQLLLVFGFHFGLFSTFGT